ncbi:MAG: HAMP domain-containing protein [Myxococcales bacterium]|nr:HAMP domain-containing protein [Myxococcales bacterium]
MGAPAVFPFRTKLTVLGALLTIVPLTALGYALMSKASETVRTMTREYQLSVAGDLSRTIESELGEAENGLEAVGRVLTNIDLPEPVAIQLAINLVAAHEAIDHVGVYALNGELVDVIREASAQAVKPPEQLSEAIRETAATENVVTGAAVPAEAGPRVLLVLPIRTANAITGFVGSLVSLQRVQQRVEQLAIERFEGLPGSLFVIDDDMRILAHSLVDRSRELASARGAGALEGVETDRFAGAMVKSGEYVESDGTEMVGTVSGLQTRPWAIVTQIPRDFAYASVDTMRRVVFVVSLIAIIIALMVAFAVARQITRPIQQLSTFADDLAARRFDRRVTVNTRDELAVLGDVLSSAAADLQASEVRIREEEAIRRDLRRYLDADLVDRVVRREQDMQLGGERREISVLFADVVAFTPIADSLAAEETVGLLNELFTILTEIVFRYEGTVDKFIGDSVMAIWGAPQLQPDHAARAIAAAEDMMRWLEAGNQGWRQKFGVTVELAIGINSGHAVVGNVGSETRMQYTAIGDVVNVAARLESIARPQQILVTHSTKASAGDDFQYAALGPRQLVGRRDPVKLFEVRL